jgi:cytochrome c
MPIRPAAVALAGLATLLCAGALLPASTVAAAGEPPDAAAKRGERLFLQCRACHSLASETAGKIGPPLQGLLGRQSGKWPGFRYSSALAAADLTWDEATLDRWLASPAALVPGTAMVYAGLPKPEDRRALIAYLREATRVAR